jgi:glutathionyl-hydroquinone reductase
MTIFSSNYQITKNEWIPLSDIMNQDYDHTAPYKIHINETQLFAGVYVKARLNYTHRMTVPTLDDRGCEYFSGDEITIPADSGDDIYLRSIYGDVNIEISEIKE